MSQEVRIFASIDELDELRVMLEQHLRQCGRLTKQSGHLSIYSLQQVKHEMYPITVYSGNHKTLPNS